MGRGPRETGENATRSILSQRIKFEHDGTSLDSVLGTLETLTGNKIRFVHHKRSQLTNIGKMRVALSLGTISIRGALQSLADNYNLAFVIRSYGILVTTNEMAASFRQADIIK